jgi:hypothetical protein
VTLRCLLVAIQRKVNDREKQNAQHNAAKKDHRPVSLIASRMSVEATQQKNRGEEQREKEKNGRVVVKGLVGTKLRSRGQKAGMADRNDQSGDHANMNAG